MDLFDNWHIFGPASPNLGEWYTHHRHWHDCPARQQRPISSGGINGLNREDNGWEDSTAAIRRDNSFRATRDYRGVYEAADEEDVATPRGFEARRLARGSGGGRRRGRRGGGEQLLASRGAGVQAAGLRHKQAAVVR